MVLGLPARTRGKRPVRARVAQACLRLCLTACLLLAGQALALSPAAASDVCDFVAEPASGFEWTDGTRRIALEFDLAANSVRTVEAVRGVVEATAVGFPAEALRATNSFLDGLIDWYRYLEDPCADQVPYPGPFENAPNTPRAPFGFGGVDATPTGPPVTIIIEGADSDSADDAPDDVQPVFSPTASGDADSDGPELAVSGSESLVLAYFGMGLVAFGAVALGTRRRIR